MKDYGTFRGFRHDNFIDVTHIQDYQTWLNRNQAGIRTVTLTSFFTTSRRGYASTIANALSASATRETVNNSGRVGWGLSSGSYYVDATFFSFETGLLSSLYGLTAARITDAQFAFWTYGITFYWGQNNFPCQACVVTGADWITSALLGTGNYAIANNQCTTVVRQQPTSNAYSAPYYSSSGNVRIDFHSAPGFCQTLNLTGNTIIGVWDNSTGYNINYSGVQAIRLATLTVTYVDA